MAIVIGGKHFGEYTYEHWFDHEYEDTKTDNAEQCKTLNDEPEKLNDPDDSTVLHKQPPPQ